MALDNSFNPGAGEVFYSLGSITAPTQNQGLVALNSPSLPPGVYDLYVLSFFSGSAPAAAELNNLYVSLQGPARLNAQRIPAIPALNIPPAWIGPFRISSDGVNYPQVLAAGNATAGVVYNVVLRAVKVH